MPVDPVMVVVLIATPIVGVAFVLVWRWQTNKWARTERQQLHHPDDYEGDVRPGVRARPGTVVVREDDDVQGAGRSE